MREAAQHVAASPGVLYSQESLSIRSHVHVLQHEHPLAWTVVQRGAGLPSNQGWPILGQALLDWHYAWWRPWRVLKTLR